MRTIDYSTLKHFSQIDALDESDNWLYSLDTTDYDNNLFKRTVMAIFSQNKNHAISCYDDDDGCFSVPNSTASRSMIIALGKRLGNIKDKYQRVDMANFLNAIAKNPDGRVQLFGWLN